MKKLKMFVVNSYKENKGCLETIESFKAKTDMYEVVETLFDVNCAIKERDWFGVLYENEVITDELLEGLPSFFELTEADILVAFKKEKNGRLTKCPRFFRSHIELDIGCLAPEDRTVLHEIILNGVIEEL